jgi:hypothetical protein
VRPTVPLAVTFVFALALAGHSQSASLIMGARANGMAYAASGLSDSWSLFGNIGGLTGVESPTASVSYHAHPSFQSFNRTAAVFATPVKPGVAGIGVFRFGDELYSEQVARVGFASQLGIASLGIQAGYVQYRAEGFGTRGVVTFGLGGITRLTSWLSVGVSITNLNQPIISTATQERLSPLLVAGVALRPSPLILVITEVAKDLDYTATWRTGLEYTAHKKFMARTGFTLHPQAAFAGAGFKTSTLTLDYALQFQPIPGISHQATLGYKFLKKKKA